MSLPTILVADDDRSIRTVLSQALGRAGYQVRATAQASTLWQWVEEGRATLSSPMWSCPMRTGWT
ncbi:hypothetical protein RAA17_07060 [Komagataeibacter rhaeticus]|nr:hypothetical protein [Komagataeibacter rhaeticus]